MVTTRTKIQTAFDGVRVAWHAKRPVHEHVRTVRSIDGVLFDATAVRVASPVVRLNPMREETAERVTGVLGHLVRTMDGVRVAPRMSM